MNRLLRACGLVSAWLAVECGERLPGLLRAVWRAWCLLGGLYLLGYVVAQWWIARLP